MKSITIDLSDEVYALLKVLTVGDAPTMPTVKAVIVDLIDHAQQGIYRPGAWERNWLIQAFGDEFTNHLEMGDPYEKQRKEAVAKPELQAGTLRPTQDDMQRWLDSFNLCPFDRPKKKTPA